MVGSNISVDESDLISTSIQEAYFCSISIINAHPSKLVLYVTYRFDGVKDLLLQIKLVTIPTDLIDS